MTAAGRRWSWIIAAFLIANLVAAVTLAWVAGGTASREVPAYREAR